MHPMHKCPSNLRHVSTPRALESPGFDSDFYPLCNGISRLFGNIFMFIVLFPPFQNV